MSNLNQFSTSIEFKKYTKGKEDDCDKLELNDDSQQSSIPATSEEPIGLANNQVEIEKAFTTTGDTSLHLAARRHDVDMVRFLVDSGTNVDTQNSEGQNALHIAAAEGDEALIKYLCDVGASPHIAYNQDRTPMQLAVENGHATIIELLADKFKACTYERKKDGNTLMHIAALNGHAECVQMLLKKGAFLHMRNKSGARCIHIAASKGHVLIINMLLQNGEHVDNNYTALHIAVESAKPAVVETLLGFGADLHIQGGKLKETPLHIGARVPDGDRCVLMLLKSGANPNIITENGETAVHVASRYGNVAALDLLLEDMGDPLLKSHVGETPLHLACRNCHPDAVKHLINYVKARHAPDVAINYINATNNDGETAPHKVCQIVKEEVAVPESDKEIVKMLLENGGDISIQTKSTSETCLHYCATAGNNEVLTEMLTYMSATDVQKAINCQSSVGWTPLLIACHKGHMEFATTLLANDAKVDVVDIEGHSALHLAAMKGYSHLVKFLIRDHNAVIDILTIRKQMPLHLAAENGQLEVCKLLLEHGARIDATDNLGQQPIHVATHNNFSEVVKLFLEQYPQLVMATSKDGNTCAHIAAMQGWVKMIEELMKFDRSGVINVRNKLTESTPLQLAAEEGHVEIVKSLVRAGASTTGENKFGFTATHLAAKNGHGPVLEAMRTSGSLRSSSKKLGLTPLHVAAYYGQADTVRELLVTIPATVKSDTPTGQSLVPELDTESGLTPLHLASYSGNENVVRLLLNSDDVQLDAATSENGYNLLHLACIGGHVSIVGLLLSRSAELLHSTDRYGKTCLHIAAMYGHYQMIKVLLDQGAEINATDKNGWTALHYCTKAGYLDVVKLLVESGAIPTSETNYGCAPIWFAASGGHNDVLKYLIHKEHDTYALIEDKQFLYNLMVVSKNNNHKPIEEFILVSPAPVDVAAKLSKIYIVLSTMESDRAKDFIEAGKQCEAMATELLVLAAGTDSAGKILTAVDRRNVEFLDVLIENEQKEVIAHTVVQRYLQELWRGPLNWSAWKIILLFIGFIACPPIWIIYTLPLGHNYYKVPIIKFMSYLTSHIYLMIHLIFVGIIPLYPTMRPSLLPYWYEWGLLVWLSGLLLFEITNPSDKSGLGIIKTLVLLFGIIGVGCHVAGMTFIEITYWPTLMYVRNQFFAFSFLMSCVQILDFLSFHHLFGPWTIIIGNLLMDLARFLAVLVIFAFGFSMQFVALNQSFSNLTPEEIIRLPRIVNQVGYFNDVRLNPITSFELMFLAVFGQTATDQTQVDRIKPPPTRTQPLWTDHLFRIVFSIYMLVSVVLLINLLITMFHTHQRFQAQSDIEWKFSLSKLIRNLHRTTTPPLPLNLVTTWVFWVVEFCQTKFRKRHQSVTEMELSNSGGLQSPRSKRGLQTSFDALNQTSIENVADWEAIARKYLCLVGSDGKDSGSIQYETNDEKSRHGKDGAIANVKTFAQQT